MPSVPTASATAVSSKPYVIPAARPASPETPLPANAKATAAAPMPLFPGVSGIVPASPIAASIAPAATTGLATPSPDATRAAAASRISVESAIQGATVRPPSRRRDAPATTSPSTPRATSATGGTGSMDRPSPMIPSPASKMILIPPIAAPVVAVALGPAARANSPSRVSVPMRAGASAFTSEPAAYRASASSNDTARPCAQSPELHALPSRQRATANASAASPSRRGSAPSASWRPAWTRSRRGFSTRSRSLPSARPAGLITAAPDRHPFVTRRRPVACRSLGQPAEYAPRMPGAIAAGHPLTAEAGARVLAEAATRSTPASRLLSSPSSPRGRSPARRAAASS